MSDRFIERLHARLRSLPQKIGSRTKAAIQRKKHGGSRVPHVPGSLIEHAELRSHPDLWAPSCSSLFFAHSPSPERPVMPSSPTIRHVLFLAMPMAPNISLP